LVQKARFVMMDEMNALLVSKSSASNGGAFSFNVAILWLHCHGSGA
jgi:hypothetical protein